MHTGLLWFDNSKTPLAVKIQNAAKRYEQKYGTKPNLCLVHPSMLSGDVGSGEIKVRPYRPVLPGNLWIGMDGEK